MTPNLTGRQQQNLRERTVTIVKAEYQFKEWNCLDGLKVVRNVCSNRLQRVHAEKKTQEKTEKMEKS